MANDFSGKRVVIYARVSTKRQAQNDLSVPDQIAHAERWIAEQGAIMVKSFVDGGASATNDNRPEFQKMIAEAKADDGQIDVILVHSLSRLFRNALHFMQYKAQLARHRVKIVSITQSFGDDPASELAVGMLALFDEYHSAENSKHVRRTMLANAARGFWNGQTPPHGFKSVAVPQPKGKDRKKLEIDPEPAEVVRYIFKTYLDGGPEGAIGISALAELLNDRGARIRGKRFHTSNVHKILTNTAYIGYVLYNQRDSRTGEYRPEEEWVPIPVPPIIDEDTFYAARAQMAARDPRMGESAAKTKTNLLTGLVSCGCGDGCGGGMTTATGKGGQYKYYACHRRMSAGKSECEGRRIPMQKLDDLVVQQVANQVLAPDRLHILLQSWLDRSDTAREKRQAELKTLRTRLTNLDGESVKVIKLVRNGICSPDDPQIATELANIAAQKRAIEADIDLVEAQLRNGNRAITPEIIEKFGSLISSKLHDRNASLRREYVRLLIEKVEVGNDVIRITGSKDALAAAASSHPENGVPNAVRRWRTRQDSNLWPLPSEGSALSS